MDESRRGEIEALKQALEEEPSHVEQVARLAAELFEQAQTFPALRVLPADSRAWLEAAAALHDIGWSVSPGGQGHHKASARLIRDHSWRHWPSAEIEIVALVARYHRKSLPKARHKGYAQLGPSDRHVVRTLSSLLRVADALDRRHLSRVRSLTLSIHPDRVSVLLHPSAATDPLEEEIAAALKKCDLAEEVFARTWGFSVANDG